MGAKFDDWKFWPNTFNAHRLCFFLEEQDQHAGVPPVQQMQRGRALVNKYYELTYERGENISTPEGAALALEELGFASRADGAQWLKRGGGERNVQEADAFAKSKSGMDIHSVPFFVLTREDLPHVQPVSLSGAQSSAAFVSALQGLQK